MFSRDEHLIPAKMAENGHSIYLYWLLVHSAMIRVHHTRPRCCPKWDSRVQTETPADPVDRQSVTSTAVALFDRKPSFRYVETVMPETIPAGWYRDRCWSRRRAVSVGRAQRASRGTAVKRPVGHVPPNALFPTRRFVAVIFRAVA